MAPADGDAPFAHHTPAAPYCASSSGPNATNPMFVHVSPLPLHEPIVGWPLPLNRVMQATTSLFAPGVTDGVTLEVATASLVPEVSVEGVPAAPSKAASETSDHFAVPTVCVPLCAWVIDAT